jgi:uncharacterized protein YigE (DUF2233 family)
MAVMREFAAMIAALHAFVGVAAAACREAARADARYVVCEFDPSKNEIRLFLNDAAGAPYGDFDPLAASLDAKGETLRFAMNAGMYIKDRSPVGLFIENGHVWKKLSTKDGPGNFHLKPNGVFWIGADGAARVSDAESFVSAFPPPPSGKAVAQRQEGGGIAEAVSSTGEPTAVYATQSGPMLVIDGALHPRFLVDATSRKRRNGVGVREDGTAVLALSDTPVTFYEFATYFRDDLGCPNALYLDGTISRLYAPELSRNDPGPRMGPIVGVVTKTE